MKQFIMLIVLSLLQVVADDKMLYGDSIISIDPVVSLLYIYLTHDTFIVACCVNTHTSILFQVMILCYMAIVEVNFRLSTYSLCGDASE